MNCSQTDGFRRYNSNKLTNWKLNTPVASLSPFCGKSFLWPESPQDWSCEISHSMSDCPAFQANKSDFNFKLLIGLTQEVRSTQIHTWWICGAQVSQSWEGWLAPWDSFLKMASNSPFSSTESGFLTHKGISWRSQWCTWRREKCYG